MPLPQIVPNLVSLARTAASADAAGVWLLHESGEYLENVYCDGLPQEYVLCVKRTPVGRMTCGRAVVEKRSLITRDMKADPDFGEAGNSPVRACFSVPLIGHTGKVHGTLACHFKDVHDPSPYDVERNELLAKLIAFALEEAQSAAAA